MNILEKILVVAFLFALNHSASAEINPANSVVKVITTKSIPDYKFPWQTNRFSNNLGSGVIIDGNRVLTAAHVINYASFIEIRKEGDPKKYRAQLEFVSHQVDLAILQVEDSTFFDDTHPLEVTSEVNYRDQVSVYGYPQGGKTISVTEGVVSRIEYQKYAHSLEKFLAIQIDAALNKGNSGGPALDINGDIVGIVMQGYVGTVNSIGYIIPSILIQTFLEDIKDKEVDGFYRAHNSIEAINSPYVKEYYGIKDQDGVLVSSVGYNETDLQEGDVIVSVDGMPIASDGTIETEIGHTDFMLAFHKKQVGDSIRLMVVRNEDKVELDYVLKRSSKLVKKEFNIQPKYYIFGGLAFTPLTHNYLNSINFSDHDVSKLLYSLSDGFSAEKVVWMQTIFPHEVNRGLDSKAYIVSSVNGVRVVSLRHLINLIESSQDDYIAIDFAEKRRVVLDRKKAIMATNEITDQFNVYADSRLLEK